MSDEAVATSPEQQRALEAFYFREARLLDNRQFRQWLALLCEDIRYLVPSRVNVQVDNRRRDQEAMLSVERELEGEDSRGCPIREEGYLQLTLRAERAYKINAWAEQPPARTRRLVGNVELLAQEGSQYRVISNFHLAYTRPGCANALYSGQRRDLLLAAGSGFRLQRREVVLDYAEIALPTLGLLF